MKQLWQSISTGKAVVTDVPAPVPDRGQILVRTGASLVSAGTERTIVEFANRSLIGKAMSRPDLVRQVVDKARREGWASAIETARGKLDVDMAPGYSAAGVVVEVGKDVEEFRVGDHVACAGGGYSSHSEYIRVPRNLAAVIPGGPGMRDVPFEEAAFGTVAAIAMQGVRLAELQIGEVVAVVGLGLIGQIAVQLASAAGCIVIGMDPSHDRCSLAKQLNGICAASSDGDMAALTRRISGGRGADVVLVAAATPSDGPVTLAAEIARDRARVIAVGAVGLHIPRKLYYMKELDLRVSRSYGPGRYDPDYEEKGHDYPVGYVRWTEGRNLGSILHLLACGKLRFAPLITHRFPISQAEKAYALIGEGSSDPYLGIVVTYPELASLSRRIDHPVASLPRDPGGRICIGVIGAGNFATGTLIPVMRDIAGIEMVGICSASGTSARSAAGRFGLRYCTSDASEILRDESINTIAICTRHAAHARQVVEALDAGKHVFCEKPLALDERELADILDAFDRNEGRCQLFVGYNRRFAPLALQLRTFISSVGEPAMMHYRINAGFIPSESWIHDPEEGGGRILGEACHFVDFLGFVCGHPVVAASSVLLPNSGRYRDDNLAATLTFADGSVGTMTYTATGDKSFSKERIEIFTGGRVAILEDFRELVLIQDGRRRARKSRLRIDKGHRGEWAAFVQSLRSGGPQPIPLEDLVNVTLATMALRRPSPDGRTIRIDAPAFIAAVRARRSIGQI